MKQKWDEQKYISLCKQRNIKLFELRQKGVPYEDRLKAVEDITQQIENLSK